MVIVFLSELSSHYVIPPRPCAAVAETTLPICHCAFFAVGRPPSVITPSPAGVNLLPGPRSSHALAASPTAVESVSRPPVRAAALRAPARHIFFVFGSLLGRFERVICRFPASPLLSSLCFFCPCSAARLYSEPAEVEGPAEAGFSLVREALGPPSSPTAPLLRSFPFEVRFARS